MSCESGLAIKPLLTYQLSLITENQGLGPGVGRGRGVIVVRRIGVDVGVAVGVTVAVGVGLGVGSVYMMVRTGGLALSRVSNRFAVAPADSSPSTSQPKLVAGLSSHDCTSETICAELHVYCPMGPTDWLALAVAEKSPPCVAQKTVS